MIEKAKLLGNSFIESQFNYTPLIWMFCRKSCYSKIEKIDHKTFKVINNNNESYNSNSLSLQSNSVSINQSVSTKCVNKSKCVNKVCQ